MAQSAAITWAEHAAERRQNQQCDYDQQGKARALHIVIVFAAVKHAQFLRRFVCSAFVVVWHHVTPNLTSSM